MGFHDSKGGYHAFRTVIPLPLHGFRECDSSGDVGNVEAIGGVLASNTTPVMRGADSRVSQEISWAASNSDPIVTQVTLPEDFDPTEDVLLELWVYSGSTDAATISVGTSWNAGATVTDTATGQASASVHKTVARIAAADIPDDAAFVTIVLTPAAHTTNALQLCGARLSYVPKIS